MILIFDFVEEFVKCDIHMKVRSCGSLCNVVKIGFKMSLSAQNLKVWPFKRDAIERYYSVYFLVFCIV